MRSEKPGLHPLIVLLLSPLAGALITLSLAPYNIWPAGILSCALFAYLLSTCNPPRGFWRGWLFGLGLFGTGASWVYVSIHEHGNASVPLALVLTGLFCAGLALLHGTFAWLYIRFIRPLPGGMLIGFPVLWVLFEWLRSWFLTGFPWLYLGYAHVDTAIAGWAPILGIYGLSMICALTGSCLFLAWRSRQAIALVTYAVIVATLWIGGGVLKPIQWVARASEEPLSVAIYQPNIPQQNKWNREYYLPILHQMRGATMPLLGHDIIVWPEAAIPNLYERARPFLDPIAARARKADTTLITGIPNRPEGDERYYNSITALGQGQGSYFKQRLVPFGEYVPLEDYLRGVIEFFNLPMSFQSRGPADQPPLAAGTFRVSPSICYEVVYPDLVAAGAREADLLITISNDSWFGDSIGPLQHLQMAQMRALENGRYMIRGTNNGVSALIDHRGQVIAESEQFVETVLTGEVQAMLGKTPFASFGSVPILSACAISLALMILMYLGFWREP
ncbi:apolipoprotein N-acyltransferase [Halioglobus japonicus]|uniref:Apolipoprotein N-acyltransferase n=1 Tax=Halioglobus japonicus TaxID=930805 RepID=A0AAP8MDI9_9GAMM|nr:apolipoprotein N-acyltransferase [Halioglobus japonicus]AQA17878.1 apolipoprotein N-acyltransferase [Halioglobus japonicus]PLW85840.1 apolipoprotein N-acyltransferase [Halioglobus japonicus]GHD17776.1 apolipoprotein N-acyltransferase [Halioglobus japonicus]